MKDLKSKKKSTFRVGRKKFYAFFFVLLIVVFSFLAFGKNGLIDLVKLNKEKDKLTAEKQGIEEENARLVEEIRLLKVDDKYIAMTARKELGMIRTNEVLYKLEKK